MRRQHPFIPCFPLVLLFVLSGCATEQRLGESRIQSRRYAKGFHVQHHRGPQAAQPERTAAVDRIPVVSVAPLEAVVPLEQTGLATSPDRGAAQPIASPAPSLQRPSAEASGAEGVVEQMGPSLPQADRLPEPINGRHPDAVPGFILSLGWFLGGVGALALDYLLVASPGIAFALGLLASIMGLLLSPARVPHFQSESGTLSPSGVGSRRPVGGGGILGPHRPLHRFSPPVFRNLVSAGCPIRGNFRQSRRAFEECR